VAKNYVLNIRPIKVWLGKPKGLGIQNFKGLAGKGLNGLG